MKKTETRVNHSDNFCEIDVYHDNDHIRKIVLKVGCKYVIMPLNPRASKRRGMPVYCLGLPDMFPHSGIDDLKVLVEPVDIPDHLAGGPRAFHVDARWLVRLENE